MDAKGRSFHPEREQTDRNLHHERERADLAIEEEMAGIHRVADEVIARARQRADELLAEARARYDDSRALDTGAMATGGVLRARAVEDRELRHDRADTDKQVRQEREQHIAMLRIERAETDRVLVIERARADTALEKRDEFLGVVSHDLRGLLGSMVLQAKLIALEVREAEPVEPVCKLANNIQRSIGRMDRLIGDLLDFVSIEAGVLGLVLEVADPVDVLKEAADNFVLHAAGKGVAFRLDCAAPLPPANFDSARILQVLGNLLGNAFKFTPAGGRIVLSAERAGSDIHVAVSDTGGGIPAEDLEAVFQRFVKSDGAARPGVGLGLYICKCIVIGHGGRIWAESRPGEGTTTHFTLPVAG